MTHAIEGISSTVDGNILYIPNVRTNAIETVSSTIDGNVLYIPNVRTNAIEEVSSTIDGYDKRLCALFDKPGLSTET